MPGAEHGAVNSIANYELTAIRRDEQGWPGHG